MANHPRPIDLAEAERRELERLQRSPSTASGLTRRARAVLLLADQLAGTEVARLTVTRPSRSAASGAVSPNRGSEVSQTSPDPVALRP